MSVNNVDSFADEDLAEDREEGEDGWHGSFAVDYEEGDVVDFETIGEVTNSVTRGVGVGYDYYFMATVGEFRGELVDVRFDTAGLRVEEVADHPRGMLEVSDSLEIGGIGFGRGRYAIL